MSTREAQREDPTVAERTVRSGEVELAVQQSGDRARPAILLIHGYPDTHRIWSRVAPLLAERFHVISYDVRGAGDSTAPSERSGYAFERLADDARAVIDALAPGRRIHVVGHDWGSIQGWELLFAEQTRERIGSFTSICGASIDLSGRLFRERLRRPTRAGLIASADQLRRSWYMLLPHVPGLAEALWRRGLAPRIRELLVRYEGVPADGEYPAPTIEADGLAMIDLYRQNVLSRLFRPRRRGPVETPVLAILPSRDRFMTQHTLDGAERYVPNLTRRRLAAGHLAPQTDPEPLARWIGEHVDAIETGEAIRPDLAPAPERPLEGKLALVTGAGSGIGRATARRFAAAGARLILVDVRPDAVAALADELAAGDAAATVEVVDVSDAAAMEALAERVGAEHGAVDVLVNNAGVGVGGPFLATSVSDWERTLGVNLWGVIHGCRLFARQMVERGRGGQIVNVASAAAYTPSRIMSAYGTSKSAVLMLSESLRAELADSGIGVTAVCPGVIATDITRTTRYVGRSAEEAARLADEVTRRYERRSYGPERVAEQILDAVLGNRAVVHVTPEAKAMRALSRISPALMRRLARIDSFERIAR